MKVSINCYGFESCIGLLTHVITTDAAKEEGMLPLDMPSSTDPATPPSALPSTSNSLDQSKQLRELYSGVPGLTPRRKTSSTTDQVKRTKRMPFPSHIAELPQPPPQFYYSKA